jgi:hypothetical protein
MPADRARCPMPGRAGAFTLEVMMHNFDYVL